MQGSQMKWDILSECQFEVILVVGRDGQAETCECDNSHQKIGLAG